MLTACLAISAMAVISTAPAAATGAADAIAYLKAKQGADGGFAEPEASSDVATTCWALLAGTSAGEKAMGWTNGGVDPLKFLESESVSLSRLGDMEMVALALAEAGGDPRNLAGKNLVALIEAHAKDGKIGGTIAEHCWGMLALTAAKEKLPDNSEGWLVANQRADGGWGESESVVIADTALAVEALAGTGSAENSVTDSALKFLRSKMGADGGFAGPTGGSNSQLTASVVRAVYAAGEDPSSGRWSAGGNSPVKFLGSMQAADGHYAYSRGVESQPAMTSAMAAVGASGKYFPLAAATSQEQGATGTHDLGATGAGMVPAQASSGSTPAPGTNGIVGKAEASGTASASGSGGLLLFLIVCAIYVIALGVAALIAAKLYQPKGSAFQGPPVPPWG